MNAKRNARRTAPPSPRSGIALPVGAHAKNTGGKKGRSGRPPNWLRRWCDDILARPSTLNAVAAILRDKDHPAFAQMWKAVADRAHGKPAQAVSVSGDVRVTLRELVLESMEDGPQLRRVS